MRVYGGAVECIQLYVDSVFELPDPENPTIHAKIVSISCT